jgi:L-ascorbate metabolism protein UlaG (beta-lactamase superfamily)
MMKLGEVSLEYLGHSGFIISSDVRIAIDPYNVHDSVGKVDAILITHEHFDHCSVKDIEKLARPGTVVVGPPHVQSAVLKVEGIELQTLESGDAFEFGSFTIEAVPAYNINKFRDSVKKIVFHPKSEGYVGYVIKQGSTVIYHTGDSDFIPEMHKLTGYGKHGNMFVTLLPVSGTYVMDADEAAKAASLLKPHLAIPMHYGSGVVGTLDDAQRFVDLCKEQDIRAEVLKKHEK